MMRTMALMISTSLVLLAGCGPVGGRKGDNQDPGGQIKKDDPNRDTDGDGFTPAQGDCNDHDATIYPGAQELCDGKDHNCNGIVDDICDDDMDGYAVCPSSACQNVAGKLPGGDCNDKEALVNPGAIEVPANMIDDNCNGLTDEAVPSCDTSNKGDGLAMAGSMELCQPWVMEAKTNGDADARSHAIKLKYGDTYKPKKGKNFLVLSTGIVADKSDSGHVTQLPGTSFSNDDANPLPMNNNNACYQGQDEKTVHDYVELTLKLKVPTNAKSFSFQFNFMSAEYPTFVGTMFNDKFLAILDSKSFKGNVSFDKNKNPITVNAGFFDVCKPASVCGGKMMSGCSKPATPLNGTGFEDGAGGGGGTDWLTTTAPVTPGETATLRFVVFDEGDHIYDSTVLIDNFQWQVDAAKDPMTIGRPPVNGTPGDGNDLVSIPATVKSDTIE